MFLVAFLFFCVDIDIQQIAVRVLPPCFFGGQFFRALRVFLVALLVVVGGRDVLLGVLVGEIIVEAAFEHDLLSVPFQGQASVLEEVPVVHDVDVVLVWVGLRKELCAARYVVVGKRVVFGQRQNAVDVQVVLGRLQSGHPFVQRLEVLEELDDVGDLHFEQKLFVVVQDGERDADVGKNRAAHHEIPDLDDRLKGEGVDELRDDPLPDPNLVLQLLRLEVVEKLRVRFSQLFVENKEQELEEWELALKQPNNHVLRVSTELDEPPERLLLLAAIHHQNEPEPEIHALRVAQRGEVVADRLEHPKQLVLPVRVVPVVDPEVAVLRKGPADVLQDRGLRNGFLLVERIIDMRLIAPFRIYLDLPADPPQVAGGALPDQGVELVLVRVLVVVEVLFFLGLQIQLGIFSQNLLAEGLAGLVTHLQPGDRYHLPLPESLDVTQLELVRCLLVAVNQEVFANLKVLLLRILDADLVGKQALILVSRELVHWILDRFYVGATCRAHCALNLNLLCTQRMPWQKIGNYRFLLLDAHTTD